MTRTNIDIDDDACAEVMRRYGFSTKRQAVNFALRQLGQERPGLEGVLELQGAGWDGNLEEMRLNPPQLEAWLNRPADEGLPGPKTRSLSPPHGDDNGDRQAP